MNSLIAILQPETNVYMYIYTYIDIYSNAITTFRLYVLIFMHMKSLVVVLYSLSAAFYSTI